MGKDTRPIIVVTGASSGLGFGICHRLLVQLSQPTPTDTEIIPGFNQQSAELCTSGGLVLVMACRNMDQAHLSKNELLRLLDMEIAKQKERSHSEEDNNYRDAFRANLVIDAVELDLSKAASVLECLKYVTSRYEYISHLICNAAMAPFTGIDFVAALKQLFRHPMAACTTPNYLRQSVGTKSADGIGLVFQTNVFSHYLMAHTLLPQFEAYAKQKKQIGRVIWVSSLTASSSCYSPEDPELLLNPKSYEGSKYQVELISSYFNNQTRSTSGVPFHLVVQPGIVPTALSRGYATASERKQHSVFMTLARLFGSQNHPSNTFKAAISATAAALATIDSQFPSNHKIHSHTDGYRDREYITMQTSPVWDEAAARQLTSYCDQLSERLLARSS